VHYLFLHAAREWSGIARAFTAAATALAKRGHTLTFVVEPDSTVEQLVSQASVDARDGMGRQLFAVEPCSFEGTWMGAALRIRRLTRTHRADVVFVHTDREHLIAAAAYRLGSRAPIVRRIPDGRNVVLRRSGRSAVWLAPTSFLFASEQDLRTTVLPRRTVTALVAPLGVPAVPNDASNARDESPVVSGEYIACVHDASARSRAAAAIRVLAMLAPRHPDLQLVIMGEGGYEDDLRMQAAALNVLHLVNFLGERADELQVMRRARLGWVVADSDTAAYGILDLMSLHVPVLASDGMIAKRYILRDITGLLVPEDDPYLTAASVASLLADEPRRQRMGDAGYARVVREFPESTMIDGFEHAAAAAVRR
jgi:glycosyltransferase involved in cell wall biosynthesis